ncbi:hypothetical protein [Streptomyces sp. NPDC047061]|uniref:hypothetical protein n=1 Tax=Streptomyces sp. NPDC047061 TaxID=3154605 RepID=UPI0033D42178
MSRLGAGPPIGCGGALTGNHATDHEHGPSIPSSRSSWSKCASAPAATPLSASSAAALAGQNGFAGTEKGVLAFRGFEFTDRYPVLTRAAVRSLGQ